MDKPLISIIIPAYNAERFLGETLLSVVNQTYENWECVIIDDGSSDNTLSVAQKWAEDNPKFKVFSKKNEGHSQTRNFGIKHAQSDYIAFLDSDDLWHPHHLETLISNLLENKADFVFSYAHRLEKGIHTNIPALKNAHKNTIWGLQEGKTAIENFLQFNKISTPFCLIKKEILEKNQCFSYYKNGEDYHTWLKILLGGGKFYAVNQATGYVRILENSASDTDRNCTREVVEILSILRKDIEHWGIDYHHYFALWSRRFFLLKDNKTHYIDAINYINSIDSRYFYILKHIAPLLPKKLLKIISIFRLKINIF